MSQTLSIEEILHRMKTHVEQSKSGLQTSSDGGALSASGSASGALGTAVAGVMAFAPPEPRDFMPLEVEIETALDGTRRVGQLNPRDPGFHNQVIQFAKKVMRRSLAWYTRPIHQFQGGVIRALQQTVALLRGQDDSLQSLSHEVGRQVSLREQDAQESSKYRAALADDIGLLKQRVSMLDSATAALNDENAKLHHRIAAVQENTVQRESLDQRLAQVAADFNQRLANSAAAQGESLNQVLAPYRQHLAAIADDIGGLRAELDRVNSKLRETILQGRLRDRDLRRYFHDLQSGTLSSSSPVSTAIPPMFPSGIKRDSEFDYFRFEELFRGDEALIASRQKEYLDFYRGRDNVVDIGCGRGEFLELLRDNGVRARGVELGTDQYLLCQEKGLDVVQQDLFVFLESLPDESLGGLFSAQVIEHLTASDQLRFVSLAYQKTSPGSPVIFETINAQSVFAVVRNFFADPTHVRPVHPETLKFAMQSAKFHDVELRFSSLMPERRIPALELEGAPQLTDFNRAIEELNDLIYGYLDYAAIGRH